MPQLTQADVTTCDPDTLATALRAGAARVSNARIGAVEVLIGVGDLFTRHGIRKHVTVDSDGAAHMRWTQLHDAITSTEGTLGYLSTTTHAAGLLACAMGGGTPISALDSALTSWGNVNAATVARAFALACGQPDPIANDLALTRVRKLAKALASQGGRTLAAADAAALITTVLAGDKGTIIADLVESAGWVPATREETERALAAAAEAMAARARLAEQPRPAGELGLTDPHNLDEAVLAAITAAGARGLDRDQVGEQLTHTVPTHVLTQSLVRLTGPAGATVYRFGRYYLAELAPTSLAGDPWPLDDEGLSRAAYDVLDAAGTAGATAGSIVETLRTTRQIETTALAVTAVLGLLAARDDSIRQPIPHGPYYLTSHAPDSTTTSSTGPATPFEQPEQTGPGRVFTGLPPQTPITESVEALDAAVLSIVRESDELDEHGNGINIPGICAGLRVKHDITGPVSTATVAASVKRLMHAGRLHTEGTASTEHVAPTGN